ncbi:MAG: hypothetical protein ACK5LN_00250 [Propioniciclava sp.]
MQRGIAENAMCSKCAGGLGGSWTKVRGTGSHIESTNGESQGLVPFLKLHNDQLVAVNQGRKRAGSGCAYLETWHNDIGDFLELRRNTGDDQRRTHDMNTATWIPDLFMKRVEARSDLTLFRSSQVPDLHEVYGQEFEHRYVEYEEKAEAGEIFSQKVPAIKLWKQMLEVLFETGQCWLPLSKCLTPYPATPDHRGVPKPWHGSPLHPAAQPSPEAQRSQPLEPDPASSDGVAGSASPPIHHAESVCATDSLDEADDACPGYILLR